MIVLGHSIIYSQTLEENITDEFTGDRILRSSWETFSMPKWTGLIMYVRASYISGTTYLDTKFIYGTGQVFSVNEEGVFMLKLSSGEIINLPITEFRVTSTGEGAKGISGYNMMGMQLQFKVSDEIIMKFKLDPPTKIRLYTTDGYLEGEVNKKEAEHLAGVFQVIGK